MAGQKLGKEVWAQTPCQTWHGFRVCCRNQMKLGWFWGAAKAGFLGFPCSFCYFSGLEPGLLRTDLMARCTMNETMGDDNPYRQSNAVSAGNGIAANLQRQPVPPDAWRQSCAG